MSHLVINFRAEGYMGNKYSDPNGIKSSLSHEYAQYRIQCQVECTLFELVRHI